MPQRFGHTLIVAGAALALVFGTAAAAQDASPSPTALEKGSCTTLPRTQQKFAALVATPASEAIERAFATIESVITLDRAAFVVPDGDPVDDATATAVAATAAEIYACLANGDFLAVSALTSDTWLVGMSDVTFVSAGTPPSVIPTMTSPIEQQAATPIPDVLPGDALTICDPGKLATGHVGLVAEITPPDADTPNRRDYLLFRDVDGRWLLDAIVTGIPGEPTCT